MKTLAKILGALIVITLSIFTSCQKQFDPDYEQVKTQILLDNLINDIFLTALQTTDNEYSYYQFSYESCASVSTIKKSNNLYITTIDFYGTCPDGIRRTGQIIIKWKKGWKLGLNSATAQTEFRNFKYDDKLIIGKLNLSFRGFNQNQNPQYSIKADNLKIIAANGNSYSLKIKQLITFTAGFYTISANDDILLVNYKAKGNDYKGQKFISVAHDLVFNFKEPLHVPVSGTKVLQINGSQEIIFNYGDGQLDSRFTVTKNNQSIELIWKY